MRLRPNEVNFEVTWWLSKTFKLLFKDVLPILITLICDLKIDYVWISFHVYSLWTSHLVKLLDFLTFEHIDNFFYFMTLKPLQPVTWLLSGQTWKVSLKSLFIYTKTQSVQSQNNCCCVTITVEFFAISKSDKSVRSDRNKMQVLKIITTWILKLRVI